MQKAFVGLLLGTILFGVNIGFATDIPVGTVWKSNYLSKYGQYRVTILSDNSVELSIDPNNCRITVTGEVTNVCTRKGVFLEQAPDFRFGTP